MYKNILVPVALDHAEVGRSALAVAQKLADPGAKIELLHVLEHIPGYAAAHLPEGIQEKNRQAAEDELRKVASGADGTVECKVVWGHSSQTILEHAEEKGVDCIVIASHKPGLQDYFLGSTAARVVRHAGCCVHVMR